MLYTKVMVVVQNVKENFLSNFSLFETSQCLFILFV